MTDHELLRQYVEGSQTAFTTLVRRHFDMVHSAAMRQLREPHAAEDVCQRVFLILAKKSESIRPDTALGPWLYNATRFACLDALKQRDRRQRHERKAAEMATRAREPGASPPHQRVWGEVEPVLDDAMARLSGSDRRLLLMRFWESRSTEEVAGILDVSANAAKKRLSRAVERLRGQLARMGVTVGTEMLPAVLIANVVKPAPAGLALKTAAAVSSAALAAGGTGGAVALKGAVAVMAWTKAKIVTVGLLALCVVGGGAYVVSNQMRPTREVVISPASGGPSAAPGVSPDTSGNPQWRTRFEATYALGPGQALKRVPPPFIPERNMYWQTEVKDMARMMPDADGMWMKYSYDLTTHWQSAAMGKPTVGTALESAVGFRPYEVEGPVDPWTIQFPGDLVVREGTTREQKLAAIQPLISETMGKPVVFEKKHVTRDAIVMKGQYHPIPARNKGGGPYEAIDIGVDATPGKQYSTSSSFEGFCGALELILRMRVVDQRTAKASQMATFRNNNVTSAVAKDPQKLSAVLSNLSRQTGLQLSVEPRELDIWVMTVGQGSATQPLVLEQ